MIVIVKTQLKRLVRHYDVNHFTINLYNVGDIPLRDLVYRVHDLPASMRALVYDFGSLSNKTEKDYIRQIVRNRVINIIQDYDIQRQFRTYTD